MSLTEQQRRNQQSEQSKTHTLFENRYYTKKELARILRVGLRMIDKMMQDGELKVIRLGRAVRFNGSQLNEQFDK